MQNDNLEPEGSIAITATVFCVILVLVVYAVIRFFV